MLKSAKTAIIAATTILFVSLQACSIARVSTHDPDPRVQPSLIEAPISPEQQATGEETESARKSEKPNPKNHRDWVAPPNPHPPLASAVLPLEAEPNPGFGWLTSFAPDTELEKHRFSYSSPAEHQTNIPSEINVSDPLFSEDIAEEISANSAQLAEFVVKATRDANGLARISANTETECLKPELVAILKDAQDHFGRPVLIFSGHRNLERNKRVGGAKNSMHLYCMAADIQIEGVSKWALAEYLSQHAKRGGIGTYCRTDSVHIDIGPRRQWHHPCRILADRAP